MAVLKIETTQVSLAFDLSHADFSKLIDKDTKMNNGKGIDLYHKITRRDRVLDVDYSGMFVRHAIFVDLVMSDNFEQDKEDIKKVIEDYIK